MKVFYMCLGLMVFMLSGQPSSAYHGVGRGACYDFCVGNPHPGLCAANCSGSNRGHHYGQKRHYSDWEEGRRGRHKHKYHRKHDNRDYKHHKGHNKQNRNFGKHH